MKYIDRRHQLFTSILLFLTSVLSYAATPLWTIVPTAGSQTTQTVAQDRTSIVQYLVTNNSTRAKRLLIKPIPGVTQSEACALAPRGQSGSQCILTLQITGSMLAIDGVHGGPALCQIDSSGYPNSNQCYQPDATNVLNISRGAAEGINISVNPSSLLFAENSTASVTVTNSASSIGTANNITASIPQSSQLSVQSNTCGGALGVGASCTITFASSTQQQTTPVSIAGDNTNTIILPVTITSRPQISITGPIQQARLVPVNGVPALSLEITNSANSQVAANQVTVTNKASCPNLSVNDTNCASIAPGSSCSLELLSNTPYEPCSIQISGSNTQNTVQTLVAFSYLGGIVFEENTGSGKVINQTAVQLPISWTASTSDIAGATSLSNGASNTNAIIANTACTGDTDRCAAQQCQNISAQWYLPAITELQLIRTNLCANGSSPCDFGGFLDSGYWSSTQQSIDLASILQFPTGPVTPDGKSNNRQFRCIRTFSP